MKTNLLPFIACVVLFCPRTLVAQSTAFSYQGRLNDAGKPANGLYDLSFRLFDALTNGTAVIPPVFLEPVPISNGLFTVELNFGSNVFDGRSLWLEISVSAHGTEAPPVTLSPRQALTPAPYALYAPNAGSAAAVTGSVSASQLTGAISSSNIANGTITGAMLAAGTIGSAQLAKPPRSGNILSSSLSSSPFMAFLPADFTVLFIPTFNTTPIVTMTLESDDVGFVEQATLLLKNSSSNSFAGLLKYPLPVGSSPPIVGFAGSYSSLAVVNGNPAISYIGADNPPFVNVNLKYVRASITNGTSWTTSVTPDNGGGIGGYTSLAMVNGSPAISYYEATPGSNLKYVRATHTNGTSWGAPVRVDTNGIVGWYTSLAVVNGNPAISYHAASTNFDLKYVRATDANGTVWGPPVNVDTNGSVGFDTSLAVVNGNPAISYLAANGEIRYVRASDADGVDWSTPITLDTNGVIDTATSLAVVNGNPAISYRSDDNLKYVRATDVDGTTWGTPVRVDTNSNVGSFSSLAVLDGRPAISYNAGRLTIVWASDPDGASWGKPVKPDAVTSVDSYTSLRIVNGQPAVSYFDAANSKLRFIRDTSRPPFAINWIALEP